MVERCGFKIPTYSTANSLRRNSIRWWGGPPAPRATPRSPTQANVRFVQPAINNFKILGWQALYFLSIGRPDIARAVALDALKFERKLTPTEKAADSGIGQLAAAIGHILSPARGTAVALPKVWGVGSRAFKFQAMGAAILTVALAVAVTILCSVPKAAYRHVPPTGETTVPSGETEGSGALVHAKAPLPGSDGQVPRLLRDGLDSRGYNSFHFELSRNADCASLDFHGLLRT
jgi:hypothetical protein